MKKRIILALAVLLTSAAALSAQKFEPYNRWMVGGELRRNINAPIGFGPVAIYGRQFSEIVFWGVGFGADCYISKKGEMSATWEDSEGNTFVRITPPYRFDFTIPVFMDLQINFSRKKSPFFAEVKAGGFTTFHLQRFRGTETTNELNHIATGVLAGLGIGKRFALENKGEISVVLGAEGATALYYVDLPLSLSVRYGF